MADTEFNIPGTTPSEGGEELNGKGATYRHAPMLSEPATIIKQRIRGALVPTGRKQ